MRRARCNIYSDAPKRDDRRIRCPPRAGATAALCSKTQENKRCFGSIDHGTWLWSDPGQRRLHVRLAGGHRTGPGLVHAARAATPRRAGDHSGQLDDGAGTYISKTRRANETASRSAGREDTRLEISRGQHWINQDRIHHGVDREHRVRILERTSGRAADWIVGCPTALLLRRFSQCAL